MNLSDELVEAGCVGRECRLCYEASHMWPRHLKYVFRGGTVHFPKKEFPALFRWKRVVRRQHGSLLNAAVGSYHVSVVQLLLDTLGKNKGLLNLLFYRDNGSLRIVDDDDDACPQFLKLFTWIVEHHRPSVEYFARSANVYVRTILVAGVPCAAVELIRMLSNKCRALGVHINIEPSDIICLKLHHQHPALNALLDEWFSCIDWCKQPTRCCCQAIIRDPRNCIAMWNKVFVSPERFRTDNMWRKCWFPALGQPSVVERCGFCVESTQFRIVQNMMRDYQHTEIEKSLCSVLCLDLCGVVQRYIMGDVQ